MFASLFRRYLGLIMRRDKGTLNEFCGCLDIWVFGYLRKYKDLNIVIDSRDPILSEDCEKMEMDWTNEYNDNDEDLEEIDPAHPALKGGELALTFYVDADHAHDRKTRRSVTGIICCLGSTPILWLSRRQGSIETSTYGAKFNALRMATEEVIAMQYLLRLLGVPVSKPTVVFGKNLGVIQNATNPQAKCKKKCTSLSFHCVREAADQYILEPMKIPTQDNFADIFTKAISNTFFIGHVHELMFRPRANLKSFCDFGFCDMIGARLALCTL
jgi:hypothetical protein